MAETTIRKTTKKKEDRVIPSDAEIISREVDVTTEEIENGFLITKRVESRWKSKGSKDDYGNYHTDVKKWYSKLDPLTIKTKDVALAEAFEDED